MKWETLYIPLFSLSHGICSVDKVIAIGKPNHVSRRSGVAPVQTVVVIDASALEVEVSMWSELSNVLDADTVPLDDVSDPTIVAFLGFQIRPYMGSLLSPLHFVSLLGRFSTTSFLPDRILFPPLCFQGQGRSIKYIVPKFDTPKKLKKHSYRTIRELNGMYVTGGDSDPCYHCSAEIVGFQQQQPWFYRACPDCSTVVVSHGTNFWCKNHDTVLSDAVAYRHRLKFNVSDSTSTTTFILLGYTADIIMPISVSKLALAYPADYGPLPPTLQLMVGQKLIFGVNLPRQRPANPYEDFRISKIWGLNMPRAQILAQLPPPPLPYRTPSPPSRHETPLPPDPAYVPPVPTYNTAPAPPPLDHVDTLPLPRPAPEKDQSGLASLEPAYDDMPLFALCSRKRPIQHSELLNTPPTPTVIGPLYQPPSNPLMRFCRPRLHVALPSPALAAYVLVAALSNLTL
ncbi:hypothetical protein LINGRAHAP2_LOCUS14467 [Linum grandiflorum]